MNASGKWLVIVVAAVMIAGAGGVIAGISIGEEEPGPNAAPQSNDNSTEPTTEEGWDKVHEAYDLISEQYVEDVDNEALFEGAIEGMIEELDDPYSVYMDPETASEFEQSLSSEFEGIGAEVNMVNDTVTIVSPVQGSPAEEAGLMPDDQILAIDGNSTEDQTLNEAVMDIRGEEGTSVVLTIGRPSASEPFEVEVEREPIPMETVESETITQNGQTIGLIEIISFSEDTATEFEEQLDALESEGIDGLLVDVRGNPGGYLNSVQDIGSLLVPEGEPIVQIEEPNGDVNITPSVLSEEKDYPIAGLINQGSASASEILAAALHEAGDYELIGETTFGKGTVQQAYPFADGSEMNLSMFRWLTSDGNNIHEEGVEPTIEVTQPDYFYTTALAVDETLTIDDNNEQVSSAQNLLQGLGFEPGRTDGYYDEQTENAVTAFQQSYDLEESGEIDEETAQSLHSAIVDEIQDPENDRQLNAAIDHLVNEAS
ncbi:carboxyl-terminal processing protease [Geomicrobium halophilum]|uniref:Carboxyl-terminal processing protease n=1 Tax=Geomicrobium halophilum TaxID=549000 RepID=A0A841PRB7_9BACL|nr:S41 family peptidase [Geomicrobium halophilum]MBB6450354.1 carboxyl-terminal processing protease [Geomicrobium halophilum]